MINFSIYINGYLFEYDRMQPYPHPVELPFIQSAWSPFNGLRDEPTPRNAACYSLRLGRNIFTWLWPS